MTAPDESTAENGNATLDKHDRVDTPNPNDVLCGRGGNINSHRGNEQFRSFVEKRKRVYLTARFKREKRLIASSIVNEIRAMDPPGRFLARKGSMKDNSGYWYDIGDEKARDKTSQALRENAPSIRAEIETEINQQRAEMRRQDTTVEPSPSAPSSSKESSYPPPPPPPPLGCHPPPNNHPAVHHAQQHGHTPPHMGHPYNRAHQSHYMQQYYDYYYHYYGYGAPPPPPPPGYTNCGAPPSAPAGYPPAPAPYWAGQSSPNATTNTSSISTNPPVTMSSTPPHPHPIGSAPASASTPPPHSPPNQATAPQQHSPHASISPTSMAGSSSVAMYNQEEEDRRLAVALQQEENVKAFEDRNRRYGSDRKSSRSTAYCAPGYRPRLLNDNVNAPNGSAGSITPKKSRPPMSASHYFGPPIAFHRENSVVSNNRIDVVEPRGPNHTDVGSNKDTDMDDEFEMDSKPKAVSRKQEENNCKGESALNHSHDHDFSFSSFSLRGRTQIKDDSEVMSLFGEGESTIPPSNANSSTLSFGRIRNMMTGKNPDSSNHSFNPMALDEDNERNHQHQQQQPLQRSRSSASHRNSKSQNHQEQNQDSSLLSQVAHHILGNFGVSGGSSWKDTSSAANDKNSSEDQGTSHHQGGRMEPEMEMELGQEVIMDVRDESSSMPPPHARGSGTQIDWASRAGCHTWIPDSIGYNISSSNYDHQGTNDRNQHDNHGSSLLQGNEHSLTRQTSYSRTDISPINSMDMDFSHSSLGGRQRSGASISRRGSHASSSLMNVFDKKNDVPNTEELLPQMQSTTLQRVPSWERTYRSRSPVSMVELSPTSGMDNPLIRVNKDKLFGIAGNGNTGAGPPSSSEHHDNRHHQNHHHPPSPIKLSSMHGNGVGNPHVVHHPDHPSQPPAFHNGPRDIDMDWD